MRKLSVIFICYVSFTGFPFYYSVSLQTHLPPNCLTGNGQLFWENRINAFLTWEDMYIYGAYVQTCGNQSLYCLYLLFR